MPQLVRVTGLEAEGHHGVGDEERARPQRFLVDLEMVVEVERDEIAATGDYREVTAAVRGLVATESHRLIETLAARVAAVVAAIPGVLSCRAVVHKPEAARRLGVGDVSAEATARGTE